jgi:solute carrier family 26 (sodium-independent sulfate anion transporter), member 11
MSTLVGNILVKAAKTHPDVPGHVIASCLAVIAGCIIVFIGLIRCGWIVDLIPLVSISAFMTGSALNIAAGQVPTLMGIASYFNTRAATYLVIINTLKDLHLSPCFILFEELANLPRRSFHLAKKQSSSLQHFELLSSSCCIS